MVGVARSELPSAVSSRATEPGYTRHQSPTETTLLQHRPILLSHQQRGVAPDEQNDISEQELLNHRLGERDIEYRASQEASLHRKCCVSCRNCT